MGIFDKIKEPIFLKEESDAEKQLNELKRLLDASSGDTADEIKQEISLVNAGIAGEKQVHFELENSHIPMYVLHDIYLEFGNLRAQIDYIIITHHHVFIVECKNLFGNIEINSNGDFIRTISYGGHTKKEGIYSPITQNRRHIELIKEMRGSGKSFLQRALFEKSFPNSYRSIVVLSNPKTILNSKYAKKEIKNMVIRADRLAEYIRKADSEAEAPIFAEKNMEELAYYFLNQSKPCEVDYTKKFSVSAEPADKKSPKPAEAAEGSEASKTQSNPKALYNEKLLDAAVPEQAPVCPKCGAPMIKRRATRGANSGNEFYGCSNYPKCRGIVNCK